MTAAHSAAHSDADADVVAHVREVVATHRRCFWLDGGGGREWSGRRSLVGWLDDDDVSLSFDAARREVRRHTGAPGHPGEQREVVGDDVFAVLAAELAAGRPDDRWVGYLGYAAHPDVGRTAAPDPHQPDAIWMRVRSGAVRVFEHPEPTADRTRPAGSGPAPPVDPAYARAFAEVQERLRAGDSYEVNLTYRRELASDVEPLEAYLRLRALNPAPYAGFLQHDVDGARGWLLSASPERFARVTRDTGTPDGARTIEARPIKGTTPRHADPDLDAAHRRRLAADPAFRAENLMITDLLRDDLARSCVVGSVRVPELMTVESYAAVHQLVTTVRGTLRPDVETVAALRALFPPGSMTGAPRERTMAIIAHVESSPRGVYSGAFGWIAADGSADLGVVIRSLATAGDGGYTLGTGGGITVHSTLEAEWAETVVKTSRVSSALGSPTR